MHTVPNGKPMTAKISLLTSFLFLPPYFENKNFSKFKIDKDLVDFLWMIPITEAEREFAVKNGSKALEEEFIKANLDQTLDESRKSVI